MQKMCDKEFKTNPINLKAIYSKKYQDEKARKDYFMKSSEFAKPRNPYDNEFVKSVISANAQRFL